MKATGKLLAAALVVAGAAMMSVDAHAAGRHGGHGHGHRHGGYGHWYPSWGFYFGAPIVWGAAWGWPYYYDPFFYGPRVVYREVIRDSYPEGVISGPPVESTEVPKGDGAPTRGPLYMNYCESARAYYPKVTTCPEGWRLATPAN
jgi:hypothetical protein